MNTKKILFINRQAPYGSSIAKESLDAVLTASAYGQDISVLFMGDGVFQLLKGQNTEKLACKNLSATLPVLPMYDIEKLYVQASALSARNLSVDDLIMPVEPLNEQQITSLMDQQNKLLSF